MAKRRRVRRRFALVDYRYSLIQADLIVAADWVRYNGGVPKIHTLAVAVLLVACLCSPSRAWSGKEHIQFTRLAMERILADPTTPQSLKDWIKKVMPRVLDAAQEQAFFIAAKVGNTDGKELSGIEYWVVAPDLHAQKDAKGTLIQPFGVAELPMHFIDLELFMTGEKQRTYKHDLSSKPKLQDIPNDMKDPRFLQAGMLPFSIERSYKNFVAAVKAGKLLPADPKSTDLDDNALRWAGYLLHYVQDNTQPQHATEDYKSESYFVEKFRGRNAHAEMEYRMVDDEKDNYPVLRAAYYPLFIHNIETMKDIGETKDLFKGTLQTSMDAYDALPLIGLAAMHASGQAGTPEKPTGKAKNIDTVEFFKFRDKLRGKETSVLEMKAHQTALAVRRAEAILRQAWDEATQAK